MKERLILIGMMGAGKSSTGEQLARTLDLKFYDTDQIIENQQGRSISKLITTLGEDAFRDIESEVLRSLRYICGNFVLSTGGGIVLRDNNRLLLNKLGKVIWLKVSPEIIQERLRLEFNLRPLLRDTTELDRLERIRAYCEERDPLYQECAQFMINTDHKTTPIIVREIIEVFS